MHRHKQKARKLGREKGPRNLMLRNLATSVMLHERVETTVSKAKAIQPIVEKLITKAKKGNLEAKRSLNAYLLNENATEKTIKELAPLYKARKGGYTRVIKTGVRKGDGARMAFIELLDTDKITIKKEKKIEKPKEVKTKSKKSK